MATNLLNVTLGRSWWLTIASIFLAFVVLVAYHFSRDVQLKHTVVNELEYLAAVTDQYDINTIQDISGESWRPNGQQLSVFSTSDETYWFKFELAQSGSSHPKLIEIDYANLDELRLWFIYDQNILSEHHMGDTLPFSSRAIEHEHFLFPVPENKMPIEVYVSIHSKGMTRLPVKIWNKHDYLTFTSQQGIFMGLFFGLMLAMAVSNFFFFITSKASTFLIYSGYVVCLALTLAALTGLGYRYLWSSLPWLQQHAVGIFASLTVWFSIIFCDRLLNVKAYKLHVSRVLNITAYVFIVGLVASLFIPLQVFIQAFLVLLSAAGALLLGVAIWLWRKGLDIAKFYTLAWGVLFVCGFMVSLDNLSFVELDITSHRLLMLGSAFETLLLALILAISHNQQKQVLLDTQAELLETERQAKLAQKDILALQQSTTEDLEYKVQERTLELEVALRELSDTNRELQEKNTLDALTGIRNRSYFDKKYQAEVRRSRRERTQLSIVMLDIDHFKRVNDKHGHLVGDECIKTVAHILKKALKRPSDDVCRYGGEEFALILPSTDLDGALTLVEQLRQDIEHTTIQADEVSVHITISAGIGTAVAELNQPEDVILALADKQLYLAKDSGRNKVQGSHLDFA